MYPSHYLAVSGVSMVYIDSETLVGVYQTTILYFPLIGLYTILELRSRSLVHHRKTVTLVVMRPFACDLSSHLYPDCTEYLYHLKICSACINS